MTNEMVHLHSHSCGSLLDGLSRVEDILRFAIERGHPAHALTDHGTCAGIYHGWREARKLAAEYDRLFKFLAGIELYMVEDRFHPPPRKKRAGAASVTAEEDESAGTAIAREMPARCHLTLLIKNEVGYRNAMQLVYRSNETAIAGGWGRTLPLADLDLIAEHHEGLICLSGCPVGRIASHILMDDLDSAYSLAKRFLEIFGEDFYGEIMASSFSDQRPVNRGVLQIFEDLKIPVVATNDNHWIAEGDWETHEVLCAIQTKSQLSEPTRGQGGRRFCLEDRCYWLRSRGEMETAFQEAHGYIPASVYRAALDRSLEIAEKVTYERPQFAPDLPELKLDKDPLLWERFQAWRPVHGVAARGIYGR